MKWGNSNPIRDPYVAVQGRRCEQNLKNKEKLEKKKSKENTFLFSADNSRVKHYAFVIATSDDVTSTEVMIEGIQSPYRPYYHKLDNTLHNIMTLVVTHHISNICFHYVKKQVRPIPKFMVLSLEHNIRGITVEYGVQNYHLFRLFFFRCL